MSSSAEDQNASSTSQSRFISPISEVPAAQGVDNLPTDGQNQPYVYDSVRELCALRGGDRPIRRLLVANNGNAAIKGIRSWRAWCLNHFSEERELEIVGMATEDDMLANAEYISRCDYLVEVPAGPNHFNYANVNLIREIAEAWNCDAVWPGWGHASENPELPRALGRSARHIVWVGPTPEAMEALGCKIGSTLIAQSVGVPVVPWSGLQVTVTPDQDGQYQVSPEQKTAACIDSVERLRQMVHAGTLEFPMMLKAAAGGGGRGIRIVREEAQLESAYHQVVAEVRGSLIFAMKLVEHCRHLEVQILADEHGSVISLGCRDCTIQRRHQKIIEEGPPIVCASTVLERMEAAAVVLCRAVGYRNAATVEFLYDMSKRCFYFLEVNARLQVEHVVTEMLTNVNLPAAQLQIAMGIRLRDIPDVSEYLNLCAAGPPLGSRHCIAARVTAEDPERDFQPTCGEIHELSFESSPDVWAYFSVGTTSRIHEYADSQFGHIFATRPNRAAARTALLVSLRSLIVRGEISTNVEALRTILQSQDFTNNESYTTWLEERVRFTSPFPANAAVGAEVLTAVLYAGVYKASRHFADQDSQFVSRLNQGQVPQQVSVTCDCEFVYRGTTKFSLTMYLRSPSEVRVEMNGSCVDCEFTRIVPTNENQDTGNARPRGDTGWYIMKVGLTGRHQRVCFRDDTRQDNLRVTIEGNRTYNFTKEKDPTQVRAPLSGKLVRWNVHSGSPISKGMPYAEIEIMKMYVHLFCEDDGIMTHVLNEGAIFSAGDLLATLELPQGQEVVRPEVFQGRFPVPVSGRIRRDWSASMESFSSAPSSSSSSSSSSPPSSDSESVYDGKGKGRVEEATVEGAGGWAPITK